MSAGLILFAWGLEVLLSWPAWIYARIRHPVVWIGTLISFAETWLNQPSFPHALRYSLGVVASISVLAVTYGVACFIEILSRGHFLGIVLEVTVASSLIASRSLFDHVAAVAVPLSSSDLSAARFAVSQIVGRDPNRLDGEGMARASLESLAENASDGVTAPVFWGVLFGLPGLATYKAVNTLDSMIGHRSDRHAAFGGFAARIDDIANLIPARLTALLIVAAAPSMRAARVMLRDARYHRSPNAGWPEAAMAGALNVRLSGPRQYGQSLSNEPWLNENAADPTAADIFKGLRIYRNSMGLLALILAVLVIVDAL